MGNARKILGNYWKTIGFKSWTTIDEMGKGKLWETMKNPENGCVNGKSWENDGKSLNQMEVKHC